MQNDLFCREKESIALSRADDKKPTSSHASSGAPPAALHMLVGRPTEGKTCLIADHRVGPKSNVQATVWSVTLITPFPMRVAADATQPCTRREKRYT